MKSFKQFTAPSEQLDELTSQKLQQYVDRATGDHTHQNMARRNTSGDVSKEYARKEALRKKGISRAIDRLHPQTESISMVLKVATKLNEGKNGKWNC